MYFIKYGDDQYIYDPRNDDEQITGFDADLAVNDAGTVRFELSPGNRMWGKLEALDLKQKISIWDDDEPVWQGVILNDEEDMYLQGSFVCVGDLAQLKKAKVRPYKTGEGGVPRETTGLFGWYLASYNALVEPEQRFMLGHNQGELIDPNNRIERSSEQWPTFAAEIDEKLLKDLGGYIRVRYETDRNKTHTITGAYLDWLADFDRNSQRVELGENLLNFARSHDPSEIITCIIPEGGSDESEDGKTDISGLPDGRLSDMFVKDGDRVYSGTLVARYGMVEERRDYESITDPYELVQRAIGDISAQEIIDGFEISALDLHAIDPEIEQLKLGQYVRVTLGTHGFDMWVAVVQVHLDIINPDNTVYVLGRTENTLTNTNNIKIKSLQAELDDMYQQQAALTDEQKNQAVKIGEVEEAVGELHNTYVHTKYSPNPDGSDFTDDPQADTKYMGTASTDSEVAPTDHTAYKWVYIVGVGGDPGTPATNIVSGLAAFSIPCDSVGVVLRDTNALVPFSGWTGTTRSSATASIGALPDGMTVTSNVPATETANGFIMIKAAEGTELGGANYGDIPISFTVGALTFQHSVSWSKSLAGQKGEVGTDAYTISIGSESITISCTVDGLVDGDQSINVPFSAWVGEQRKAASVTVTGLPAGMTVTSNVPATDIQDGAVEIAIANLSSLGGASVRSGQIGFSVQVDSTIMARTVNWSKALSGADGTEGRTYMIELNTEQVKRLPDGEIMPPVLTGNGYYITGDNPVRIAYNGWWSIQTSDDGIAFTTRLTANDTSSFSANTQDLMDTYPDTQFVKAVLFSDAERENKLYERTLPLILENASYLTKRQDGLYAHETEGDENYNVGSYTRMYSGGVEVGKDGTALSRFRAKLVELGIGAVDAVINLCGGLGLISQHINPWGQPALQIKSKNGVTITTDTVLAGTSASTGANIVRDANNQNIGRASLLASYIDLEVGKSTYAELEVLSDGTIMFDASNYEATNKESFRKAIGFNDIQNLTTINTSMANLQATINGLPKYLVGNYLINVSPGTVAGNITIEKFTGPGRLDIRAQNANGTDVATVGVLTHNAARFIIQNNSNAEYINFQGFTATSTAATTCFFVGLNSTALIYIQFCNSVAGASTTGGLYGIHDYRNSANLYCNGCTMSNKAVAFYAARNSNMVINNSAGTGNATVYYSTEGGSLHVITAGPIAGTALYNSNQGSIISMPTGDSVVEQSSNKTPTAGWVWKKWASGILECWQTVTVTVSSWTAWANGWNINSGGQYGGGAFPIPFVGGVPEFSIYPSHGTFVGSCFIVESGTILSMTNIPQFYLGNNGDTRAGTVMLSMRARGRWK